MRHISLAMCRAEITRRKVRRRRNFSEEQKIMPTMFKANPKVDQLRAELGHPIVDADAHQIEMAPVFLDFRAKPAAQRCHSAGAITSS
jgi:hypothetical protein